jgi:hypothetical protein
MNAIFGHAFVLFSHESKLNCHPYRFLVMDIQVNLGERLQPRWRVRKGW